MGEIDIVEKAAERAASSKVGNFIAACRLGWNSYSFIFYIGTISAILGGLFGYVGWASIVITILFFYYTGKFEEKVALHRESKEKREKTQKKEEKRKDTLLGHN